MVTTLGRCHRGSGRRLGYFDDPLVSAELEGMVDEMELLGYDLDDPEMMGNVFKNIGAKIKTAFNKKKGGSLQIGPQGISYTNPVVPVAPAAAPSASDKVKDMLKNPLVLGGTAAAAIAVVMILKKKRGKK